MIPTARLRILCVDDNRDIADSTTELLELLGYEARAYYNGADALNAINSFAPDACLLDLNMPGMDGDELAVRIRASGNLCVLIAVTAASDSTAGERIAAAGFSRHLVKPVESQSLLAVLAALNRSI